MLCARRADHPRVAIARSHTSRRVLPQHGVLGEDPARGVASRYRDSGMVGTSGAQHPDAFASAELDATAVPVAYCILTPQSWASQDRVWLQENVPSTSSTCVVLQQDDPYPPSVVRDEVVTHVVDEPALVETQSRALAQHKTQVVVYDGYYTLSNHVAARLSGREGFARFDLATGDLVPAAHGAPWHAGLLTDLEGRR